MSREIDAFNDERVAGGVRKFVGGLSRASRARSLRARSSGRVLVTDGPLTETWSTWRFWVLEAADLPEALA